MRKAVASPPDPTASKVDPQQLVNTTHDGRPRTLMPPWGKQLASDTDLEVTYMPSLEHAG